MKNLTLILKSSNDLKTQALAIAKKVFPHANHETAILKDIHNGYTNFSFLIVFSNGKKYQIRIPHDLNIIDRNIEYKILNKINDDSFIYFDKKTGIAVKKWIEGKNPGRLIYKTKKFTNLVFQEIKKLHSIPVIAKKSEIPVINFDLYNDNLYKLKFMYQKKYLCLLDRHRDDKKVINHSDINPLNIIFNKNNIRLIDYEWGSLNSDYWDYANYIRETNLSIKKCNFYKYINHFDEQMLKDYLFISSVYAHLWALAMPDNKKIKKYRIKTLNQVRKYFKGVVNREKYC